MFKPVILYFTDGYKIAHKKMLAPNTVRLYGTWIPRSVKYAPGGIKKIVSFGQQLVVRWLHDNFQETFFSQPVDVAVNFSKDMSKYLGMDFNGDHFIALHQLGYLPIRIKSLPEGIETDPNVPHMTFINTVDGFAWLTLFLETIISALAWKPSTSATIGLQYRRNLVEWVMKTCPEMAWLIPYLCHDFSARGLDPWTMISSGLGHAANFRGSDTLVVIPAARYFYNEPEDEVAIESVNASEHSVSTTCIFTMGEMEMLKYWMEAFPKGIFSAVMDTMDLTRVVTPEEDGYLTLLKEMIMTRDGKLVIRPDSSPKGLTPTDMLCGHDNELSNREMEAYFPNFYRKGLIQCLWEIFGGVEVNGGDGNKYKMLDPHIGAIYGDSITLDIQVDIYCRLAEKGFAAVNTVLGIGSFTYQFNTRDTFGWAAKGAWFETLIDGVREGHDIYKDPMTDSGMKKSLKGLIMVDENLVVHTQCTPEQEAMGILHVIYEDGVFYNQTTLAEVRTKMEALSQTNN